jgi:hypothetical protein
MSTLTTDPGFPRGSTLGITNSNTYDAQVGDGSHLLGVHKVFLDTNPATQSVTTNETVECIAVKNCSGSALLPKTLVKFKEAATLTQVDAAANNTHIRVGVVDEYLPATGVPNNEVFWVVVRGPTTILKTSGSGEAITAGEFVSVATSSDAGKCLDGTGAKVGIAIEAAGDNATELRVLAKTSAV